MKLTPAMKLVSSLLVLAAVGILVIRVFTRDGRAPDRTDPAGAVRENSQGGEKAVVISGEAQRISGISAAPLGPLVYRKEIPAYGTVMDLQDFFAARNRIADAKAAAEKTRARLEASRKAYERLKTLYQEGQDVSAKALQEAEAVWKSGEADAGAAQATLEAVEVTARQQWGNVLAAWLITASPDLDRLSRRREVLIRLTLPPDADVRSAPRTALVTTPDGHSLAARLISPSPRTDPRIQGMSFFYVAPAAVDLISGMNVTAHLPVGSRMKGVFIPAGAVVRQQGRAWVYVQESPERFVRREVPTANPVKDGYFAAAGFTAGERIVVKGAQVLLSAEFLPARQEEED